VVRQERTKVAKVWGKQYQRKEGSWWARLRFPDPVTGRTRYISRKAKNKRDAADLVDALKRKHAVSDGRALLHERKTFGDLLAFFEARYVKEAIYAGDRKIGGYRSVHSVRYRVGILRTYFGARLLTSVTYESLRTFREDRLTTPTYRGTPGRSRV